MQRGEFLVARWSSRPIEFSHANCRLQLEMMSRRRLRARTARRNLTSGFYFRLNYADVSRRVRRQIELIELIEPGMRDVRGFRVQPIDWSAIPTT